MEIVTFMRSISGDSRGFVERGVRRNLVGTG
jgi:hypothetical protein